MPHSLYVGVITLKSFSNWWTVFLTGQLAVYFAPSFEGMREGFKDQHSRPLGHHEPSPVEVEGS